LTKLFGVSVNNFEERPVTVAKTFPELNQVVIICEEKLPKFFGNGSQVNLKEIDRRIKYKSSHVNRVYDNNDFCYSW